MISMSNQFNELEIDMHTNMEMVDVSRLPKELSYTLTTLYKYNKPLWEWCIEFIRILYEIIDVYWSKGEWENQRIELELEDKHDFRITQDNFCEDLDEHAKSIAKIIFYEEKLTEKINDKKLIINTHWIVAMEKLTLIFSMKKN